jgi:hypothetical protein
MKRLLRAIADRCGVSDDIRRDFIKSLGNRFYYDRKFFPKNSIPGRMLEYLGVHMSRGRIYSIYAMQDEINLDSEFWLINRLPDQKALRRSRKLSGTLSLREINSATPEGKLLVSALAILHSQPTITTNGKTYQTNQLDPDQVLGLVNELAYR